MVCLTVVAWHCTTMWAVFEHGWRFLEGARSQPAAANPLPPRDADISVSKRWLSDDSYAHSFGRGPDNRVSKWLFVDSDTGPIAMIGAYLVLLPLAVLLSETMLPKLELKLFATVHNGILFFLSAYMVVETVRCAWTDFNWSKTGFRPFCNAVDSGNYGDKSTEFSSPAAAQLAAVIHIHYLSKAYEFVDTFIMVFKKNYHQVSFLHVFHHATTFFPVWYLNIKYGPGGDAWFCCFLNSFVHVLMYSYYFGANLGFRSPLKPYMTMFQMCQFVLFIVQSAWGISNDCYQPRIQLYQLGVQCITFLLLFGHYFFFSAHAKNKGSKGAKKTK